MNVPSRSSPFEAIVSEVQIVLQDLADDHSMYKIMFEDNHADALAFAFQQSSAAPPVNLTVMAVAEVGSKFLPALKSAEVTAVTSTTITIDAGTAPPSGGGIEVRWSDAGWAPGNDRNLVGRFSTQNTKVRENPQPTLRPDSPWSCALQTAISKTKFSSGWGGSKPKWIPSSAATSRGG